MCILLIGNMIIVISFLVALIALVGIVDVLAPKIRYIKDHVNIVRFIMSGLVLLGIGGLLLSGLSPTMPIEKVDKDMRSEQLFINVRQDSLQHLMDKKELKFNGAGLFSNKATLQLPIGSTSTSKELVAELDTLASSFNKKLQVKSINDTVIKLQCPSIKQDGITYITVPVIVMINLMELDYALKVIDTPESHLPEKRDQR